jgi:Zn-dependent protease/predicted transcriptional regulator
MFNLPSIRVGRLFGIPLEINISWIPVFLLVTWSLAAFWFPPLIPGASTAVIWLVSAVSAVLFFGSVVVHEISHSLVARIGGLKIERVTLFLFGGVSQMEEEPATPGLEFAMALAGPGASLVIGAVLFGLTGVATLIGAPAILLAPMAYLSYVNIIVGAFNLLPGFPMDGGRVVRAIFWKTTGDLLKATRWASRMGQALGYLMIAIGFIGAGFFGRLDLVWLVLLGWFLTTLASSAYQQQVVRTRLSHLPVSDVMSSPVVFARGDMDLEALIDEFFLGQRHSRYPLTLDGEIAGLVSLAQVKAVPRERWRETRAVDVAERDIGSLIVDTSTPVESILSRLVSGPGALLVSDGGRIAGIVTRSDVVHALHERSQERQAAR